jgi:hypothetical protein
VHPGGGGGGGVCMCVRVCVCIYMLPFQTENGKQKSRRFSLIPLPFAHSANGSLLFIVC